MKIHFYCTERCALMCLTEIHKVVDYLRNPKFHPRTFIWSSLHSLLCTIWWAAAASLCGGFFFVWLWSSAASCGFCCFHVCFCCSVWACRCFLTPCTSIESRARMPCEGHQRGHGKGPVVQQHPRDREPHSTLKSSTHAYFPAGLEVFKIF